MSYVFPPPVLGPLVLSTFLAEYVTGQFNGGYLASHSSQHAGIHSLLLSYYMKSCHGCFSRLGARGSAITTWNPGSSEMCVVQTGVLFLSL